MYFPLILVMAFCVGAADSTKCYNCIYSSNDARSGQQSTCSDPINSAGTAECTGDFCLVTTQHYWDNYAGSVVTHWRQCGTTKSLPSGASTSDCLANNAVFQREFFINGNLCCYEIGYSQTEHYSNVTNCFCSGDYCNDLLFRESFSPSDSNPTTIANTMKPTISGNGNAGNGNAGNALSDSALGALLIPIVSTAVVAVAMILSVICLWTKTSDGGRPRYNFVFLN